MARGTKRSSTASSSSERPTLRSIADFARHLDLSAWTVSRAINGHPEVQEKTRQRIFAAMEELGFQPNPLARGLGGRRTGMIGVCFMGLGNPVVDQKVYALQEFFRRHRLQTLMEVRMRDEKQELRAIENFRRIHVDGIVLLYSELAAEAAVAAVGDTPCVQVDPHFPQTLPAVSLDRQRAMALLMEHLFKLGHRSFALFGPGRKDFWRWPALVEVARGRGLEADAIFTDFPELATSGTPLEQGQAMARAFLALKQRPTAILAANDQIAISAIHTLHAAGVVTPRDVSVTGFDHIEFGRKLHPTLTTIDQNSVQMMDRAGQLLLQRIKVSDGKRNAQRIDTIEPQLILGESTGPAP